LVTVDHTEAAQKDIDAVTADTSFRETHIYEVSVDLRLPVRKTPPTAPTLDAVRTVAGSVEATIPLNMPSMTLAEWTSCMENTPKNMADKSNFLRKVTFLM
jgi:hypothetical protein